MISINDSLLSYSTVKHLIINCDFCLETTKIERKQAIIKILTTFNNTCYDISSYYRDIQHDNSLDDDNMYQKDIIEIGNLIAKISK